MSALAFKTIAIIGFGEAGGILGAELARKSEVAVRAYDILLADAAERDAIADKGPCRRRRGGGLA